jgi:hypothetical protein
MPFEPIRIGNTVITKKAKTNTYEIKNEASPQLMKSIGDKASFEATDAMTMREYLKRVRHATELHAALHLVHDLGRQMQALIAAGRGIACIGTDDVLVITHRDSDAFTHESINDLDSTLGDSRTDPQFLFLNDHLLFELDDDGALIIDHALPTPKGNKPHAFLSPELRVLLKPNAPLPQSVHFKTIYHSAAQLIIYFLLNVDDSEDAEDAEDASAAYLNPIKCTKLYWFLLRCLAPVSAERKYMYI